MCFGNEIKKGCILIGAAFFVCLLLIVKPKSVIRMTIFVVAFIIT